MMARNTGLVYSERKGLVAKPVTYTYHEPSKAFIEVTTQQERQTTSRVQQRAGRWVRDVFLPQGYPESVSPDYLQYQFWDSIQAYCSNIAGALSLKATLTGLGVGEGTATPLAATLTWLLKDGSGMAASIAFAYWRGSQLDCNSKQWRLFADVANDMNHFIRLLGPLLPVPFITIMCLSALMLALVGVAGGATRAAFAQHQARGENMADVAAKDGSQETMVNLAALITSITLLPTITANLMVTWIAFTICTSFHLYANYRAVRAVKMESINRPRLLNILQTWFSSAAVPSIEEANFTEPLLFGPAFNPHYFPHGFNTSLGSSFHWALEKCQGDDRNVRQIYEEARHTFEKDNYLICCNLKERQLHIVYCSNITMEEELRAFFTAYLCVLNYIHVTKGSVLSSEFVASGLSAETPDSQIISAVRQHSNTLFPAFLKAVSDKGWHVQKLLLAADEWRLS